MWLWLGVFLFLECRCSMVGCSCSFGPWVIGDRVVCLLHLSQVRLIFFSCLCCCFCFLVFFFGYCGLDGMVAVVLVVVIDTVVSVNQVGAGCLAGCLCVSQSDWKQREEENKKRKDE